MGNELLEVLDILLKIITIAVCTVNLYNFVIKISNGNKTFQPYFYLVFYFFYILPLILQIVSPSHQYIIFWRANEAMADPLSNVKYDLFALVFSYIIVRSGKKATAMGIADIKYNKVLIVICTWFIIFVFAWTIAQNGISVFLTFAAGYLNQNLNVNEVLLGSCVLCYLTLLGHRKYISRGRFVIVTLLTIVIIWIIGKRYIIAETVMIGIFILSITGDLNGKKVIRYIAAGGVGIIAFCVFYGYFIKGNLLSVVDYFMVDMSRQYTLVYQFFCSSIGRKISIGQFDAILYLVIFWIPRSVWPGKPYPFVNQLTYSLVSADTLTAYFNMGWATTCSIFSDFFDSLSWIGIIVAFFLITYFLKVINRSSRLHYKILAMYFTIHLITVQFSAAIVQIFICLLIFIFSDLIGKNTSTKKADDII